MGLEINGIPVKGLRVMGKSTGTEQKPCTITIKNNASFVNDIWYWHNTENAVFCGPITASNEITAYPGMLVLEYRYMRSSSDAKIKLKIITSDASKVGTFDLYGGSIFAGDKDIDFESFAAPVFNSGGNVTVTITDAE